MSTTAPLVPANQYPDTVEGRAAMQADLVAATTMLRNLVWDGQGLNSRYVTNMTVHRSNAYGRTCITHPQNSSMYDNWSTLSHRFVGITQQQLQDIHIALRDGNDGALRSYGFSASMIAQLNANGGRQRQLLMRVAEHFGTGPNFTAARDRDTSDNGVYYSTSIFVGNDPCENRANPTLSYADLNLVVNDVRLNGGPFAALMTGNNNGFIRSNQFDNPQAAETATQQLLGLIQTGLTLPATAPTGTPKPTLSPTAIAYMSTLFNSTNTPAIPTGADLTRIATETGLPAATITALATFAQSVENRNLGRTVATFLNTNNTIEHIHDNGIGVAGITADDIAGLRTPTSNPRAHTAYNALIGQINSQAGTLIRGGGSIATTQPATVTPVTVDGAVAEGTERGNTPVLLSPALAGRVNNLRTALTAGDIAGITSALRGNVDNPPPTYREQLQMLREALRVAGTPAEQVNAMTERQIWDALRQSLGNTNPGVNAYLEFIAGGDPQRARTELATLRTNTTLAGYFSQTTPPPVIARIESSTTTGPSVIPRLDSQAVVNTQTGLMLEALASNLPTPTTGSPQLTKAQIDGLNMVFQAANSGDAQTALNALFPAGEANNAFRAYIMGLYNDTRQRRVASNLFNWMSSNTNPDSQNSIASIASGTTTTPAVVSASDLRILGGILQGRTGIGTEVQRGRATTVQTDFTRVTEINRANIFEGPAASTSVYTAPTTSMGSVGGYNLGGNPGYGSFDAPVVTMGGIGSPWSSMGSSGIFNSGSYGSTMSFGNPYGGFMDSGYNPYGSSGGFLSASYNNGYGGAGSYGQNNLAYSGGGYSGYNL